MPVGQVKWFDAKKGFGFIKGPQGEDIFAHYTTIEGTGFRRLYDGEHVEYEATAGPKGYLAIKIRRISPDQAAGNSGAEFTP